jgi:CubicO group peptidase (beta-lactamase class C family)
MDPAFPLGEVVRDARARTRVPGVAAGLLAGGRVTLAADGVLALGSAERVRPDTPFRIASLSKPFTASLVLTLVGGERRVRDWLGHTSGWRAEARAPLPEAVHGLFSYSNAGYWAAGEAAAAVFGGSFADAMRGVLLAPLGLAATGYDEPPRPARGHLRRGSSGHRPVPVDHYAVERRPSGGLWSTAGDLLRFAEHHLGGPGPLSADLRAAMRAARTPALGAAYGLGWWRRDAGAQVVLDHEGSVAGYQSLLLLVPAERLALVVLTNSWRGSGLVRRVVAALGVFGQGTASTPSRPVRADVAGAYTLDDTSVEVTTHRSGTLTVAQTDVDPVTGARTALRYRAEQLAENVFGVGGGLLMSHRLDFPRRGVARVGWVALPRAGAS